MPESLTSKTLSTVVDGAIPIKKTAAAEEADDTDGNTSVDESAIRRSHRQRMKAFFKAAKSVA